MSYERQDASLRVIGISVTLLVGGIIASLAVCAWWYGGHARLTAWRQTSFTFGPHAEPDIRRDWREVEAAAEERLTRYDWVDRAHGVARIPIERAMELTAQGTKPAPAEKEPGQVP